MTYRNCKKLIENATKKGTKTPEYIEDIQQKLDVFLLNNRLTEEEYTELVNMLTSTDTE